MSPNICNQLPETLKSVATRPLFVMRLDVRPYQIVGGGPGGFRRTGMVPGGLFEGERLAGDVVEVRATFATATPPAPLAAAREMPGDGVCPSQKLSSARSLPCR
jgi:hypothetical protein